MAIAKIMTFVSLVRVSLEGAETVQSSTAFKPPMQNNSSLIAEKEAQLAALKAQGRPLLIIVMVLALITMASALCGSLIGLPPGLHLITGVIMSILSLVRIPAMKQINALALEVRDLKTR